MTLGDTLPLLGESELSSMLLLLLGFLGFCGRVGLAARAGFAPCGTGGLGLTGPPGEFEEDVALRRGAGSGLVSPRGGVFSGEPVALLSGLSGLEDWKRHKDKMLHHF